MNSRAVIFLLCAASISLSAQQTVSLLFGGDAMGHTPQHQLACQTDGTYNYEPCFRHIKPYVQAADFAFVNFEVTLSGAPYTGYPTFSAPDTFLYALQEAGFDLMQTANNHIMDKGKNGLERTIRQIEAHHLPFAGSYINQIQRDSLYPLILEIKGLRMAVFCCTYGTNGNAVPAPCIVNVMDTAQIISDLNAIANQNIDLRLMLIHWGNEYQLKASSAQQQFARFLIRHGFNLIVGSHPHVVQNVEFIPDKNDIEVPVFYSLGNLVSNQRWTNSNGGILAQVEIGIADKAIKRVSYLPVYVHKGMLNGLNQYHLIPTPEYRTHSEQYILSTADSLKLVTFDTNTGRRLSNLPVITQPYKPIPQHIEWRIIPLAQPATPKFIPILLNLSPAIL